MIKNCTTDSAREADILLQHAALLSSCKRGMSYKQRTPSLTRPGASYFCSKQALCTASSIVARARSLDARKPIINSSLSQKPAPVNLGVKLYAILPRTRNAVAKNGRSTLSARATFALFAGAFASRPENYALIIPASYDLIHASHHPLRSEPYRLFTSRPCFFCAFCV